MTIPYLNSYVQRGGKKYSRVNVADVYTQLLLTLISSSELSQLDVRHTWIQNLMMANKVTR